MSLSIQTHPTSGYCRRHQVEMHGGLLLLWHKASNGSARKETDFDDTQHRFGI